MVTKRFSSWARDGRRVRVVDFEDCGPSERAFELAILVEHLSAWSDAQLDADAFVAGFELAAAERARLAQFPRLAALFWMLQLRPASRASRRNPPGTLPRQAERLLQPGLVPPPYGPGNRHVSCATTEVMAQQPGGEPAPAPAEAGEAARDSHDLLGSVPGASGPAGSESLTTVLVAFGVNVLIAVAKTAAAVITQSASLVAEAAHSWADAGNEIFLLVADRRSRRPPDRAHPFGHGREAYVWSLFAAVGLFVAGAVVSVTHGVQELRHAEPAQNFAVGYIVLAVSFVLETVSFLQSVRQAKPEAESMQRDLLEHVLATSDPTLRAVFAEDSAALIGLVIATAGLGLHQLTNNPVPDAVGSILIGALLAVVAVILINRNRRFLIGQEADPRVRKAAIQALLAEPEVARVTYLRLEIVGPRMVSVIGDVDLSGNDTESRLAVRLRALEARICESPAVAGAVLSLSAPDEPTLMV